MKFITVEFDENEEAFLDTQKKLVKLNMKSLTKDVVEF